MSNRYKVTIIIITLGIFLSCKSRKTGIISIPLSNIEYKSTLGFDSLLLVLFEKYPYGKEFRSYDNIPLNQLYYLKKRVYFPEYKNLRFEDRRYNYSSIDRIELINIYNDSFQFVLPLTDLYYLNVESRKFSIDSNYSGSLLGNLNFGKELTSLGYYLKIKNKYQWKELLDIVMNFVDAKLMNNKMEFEKYQIEIKNLIQDKSQWGVTKKCLLDLKLNNGQFPYNDENKLIYYNEVVVFIFTIYSGKIKVEYLNTNCSTLSI